MSFKAQIHKTINLKWFSLVMLLTLATFIAHVYAHAGGKGAGDGGGGGDPLANEFMILARSIANAIPDRVSAEFGFDREFFKAQLDEIDASLETHSPIVSFPKDLSTIRCFEYQKLGCVSADGFIQIARIGWIEESSLHNKIETVAMELIMRFRIKGRYSKGLELANKIAGIADLGVKNRILQPMTKESNQVDSEICQTSVENCLQGIAFIPPGLGATTVARSFMTYDRTTAVEITRMTNFYQSRRCGPGAKPKAIDLPNVSAFSINAGPDSEMVWASLGVDSLLPSARAQILHRQSVYSIAEATQIASSLVAKGLVVRIKAAGFTQIIIETLSASGYGCD